MPVNDVFIGSEALRQGKLSPYQLRTRFHAIFPDVYVAQCTPLSLRTRSEAAWLWSGRRGVLAGLAAAVLHSLSWIDDDEAVELIWRNQHSPGGVTTRNHRVEGGEVTRVAGLPGDHTCAHRVRSGATTIPWRCGGAARRTDARQTFLRRRRAADRRAATGHSRPAATKSGTSAGRFQAPRLRKRRGCGCYWSTGACRRRRRRSQ